MIVKLNRISNFFNLIPKTKKYPILPELNIKIVDEFQQCKNVIEDLRSDCATYPLLGFDCEWNSERKKRNKIALVQFASNNGLCALIRLNRFRRMPVELKDLLFDVNILKVGIQPITDGLYLTQDYNVKVRGTLDLRFLAVLTNCQPRGLEKLSKQHLNIEIKQRKHAFHLTSDWEAKVLSDKQIEYAAKDAQVGIELFKVFASRLERRYFWMNEAKYVQNVISEYCRPYVDKMFKDNFDPLNFDVQKNTSKGTTFSNKMQIKYFSTHRLQKS